jgi:hypothetical protein
MLDRILMGVVEASQVGFLVSEPGFPEVMPDFATGGVVDLVDPRELVADLETAGSICTGYMEAREATVSSHMQSFVVLS